VVSASLASNLIGVYVVYFEVPLNALPGTQRPLALAVQDQAGNAVFSNGSAIAAIQ
jgi:hypothetical protein